MTLWLILGAMSAAAVAVLFLGLRLGGGAPAARADHDLAVYRAQLKELERDLKRGVLDRAELDSARLEVERRMLAADAARGDESATGPARSARVLSLAAILLVPAGAFALYFWLGQPGVESLPFAERSAEQAPGTAMEAPDVEAMVAGLRARLEEDPDDPEGWAMLGRSSLVLGRMLEAVEAYRRARDLAPQDADINSALGEARVVAADGIVGPEARRDFEQALASNPGDIRGRFYLALAREQDGDAAGALEAMVALLADAPPDAPWADGVSRQAARIAESLGLDPAEALPGAGPAAGPAGGPAVSPGVGPTDGPSAAEIEGMVANLAARLEDEPDDVEGWRMLARSYEVLGEPAAAAEAYGRIAALRPEDTDAKLDHALALIDVAGEEGPPPEAVALLETVAARDPLNRDALFYLGEAARLADDPAGAELYWSRLLELLPPDEEAHGWLKARIAELSSGD